MTDIFIHRSFRRGPAVLVVAGFLLLYLLACGMKEDAVPRKTIQDSSFTASYTTTDLKVTDLFQIGDTASLKDDSLRELSGLVHSSAKDGSSFWGEEDSGNKDAIYLLDSRGRHLGTKYLAGVLNRDWEDIAGGPGPEKGKYYLYVGDIGDNFKIFPFISIYRFVEPGADPAKWTGATVGKFDVINLRYPDGPHDAEALMVDPVTRNIYVITKTGAAGVYVAPYPQDIHKASTLKKLGTLPVSTVTAADISPDGSRILIKNYQSVFLWQRRPGESISRCLERRPEKLDYHVEPQGESVAWNAAGTAFYTISEKVGNTVPVLYGYISH